MNVKKYNWFEKYCLDIIKSNSVYINILNPFSAICFGVGVIYLQRRGKWRMKRKLEKIRDLLENGLIIPAYKELEELIKQLG